MRTVLFITYYFPPAGGPGVQRVMGFVRHLPEYGWQPVILTVDGGTFPNRDEEALADVPPEVPVYRTRTVEPFALFNRLRGKSADEEIPFWYTGKQERQSLLMRVSRWVRANLFIPDGRVGWLPFAGRAVGDIVRIHGPSALLTTSPPNSVHLIGKRASRFTGLPWVADLRDPWTQVLYNRDLPRTMPARWLDRRLEQSALSSAAAITCTTETLRDTLGDAGRNAVIVPNGYEERDFVSEVEPISSRFQLTFVGNLSDNIDVAPFLTVVRDMARDDEDFAASFRLQLVGSVSPATMLHVERLGLGSLVETPGFVPHADAVHAMRSSTCLLFAAAHDELHAKLFEYLAAGRPMLALGNPGGNTDALLRESARQPIVPSSDTSAIRARLAELFHQWQRGALPAWPPAAGTAYSRRALAGRLADVLNSVA